MSGARPDTWMPWYIGDYLKDTMHLNAEQDGAYRRLIDACWMANGLLPDDDFRFAAVTKLSMRRWLKVRPIIMEFFTVTAAGLRLKKTDEELEKASNLIARASAGGVAKAQKEAAKHLLNGCVTPTKFPLNRA